MSNPNSLEIDPNAMTVEQKLMKAKVAELVQSFRHWVEKTVKDIVDDSAVPVEADNVRALVFSAVFNEVIAKFLSTGVNPEHFKTAVDQIAELMKKEKEKLVIGGR